MYAPRDHSFARISRRVSVVPHRTIIYFCGWPHQSALVDPNQLPRSLPRVSSSLEREREMSVWNVGTRLGLLLKLQVEG